MKLIQIPVLPRSAQAARGITLVEMMVALGVASLVLTALFIVFTDSARCFAATGNYVIMDRNSRNALDRLTREIRRARTLTGCTTNRLEFTRFGTTNSFVYQWDSGSRQLTEWQTGNAQPSVLLTECDELAFSMQNATFVPTTIPSEGKAIGVTWKCSRTILGKKINTEDMQQALIVLRNKS